MPTWRVVESGVAKMEVGRTRERSVKVMRRRLRVVILIPVGGDVSKFVVLFG